MATATLTGLVIQTHEDLRLDLFSLFMAHLYPGSPSYSSRLLCRRSKQSTLHSVVPHARQNGFANFCSKSTNRSQKQQLFMTTIRDASRSAGIIEPIREQNISTLSTITSDK